MYMLYVQQSNQQRLNDPRGHIALSGVVGNIKKLGERADWDKARTHTGYTHSQQEHNVFAHLMVHSVQETTAVGHYNALFFFVISSDT